MTINTDESWIEGMYEVCAGCEKNFWAEHHNEEESGWFCDGCLENSETQNKKHRMNNYVSKA